MYECPHKLICRSGNRSVLAALTMRQMGFENVRSLKLGIKGWNDNDLEMLNIKNDIVSALCVQFF
jgi:rhodanese-related sulfurtransferase